MSERFMKEVYVLIRPTLIALGLLFMGGCWNGDQVNLGNVSVGQQMMDLSKALEAGALTDIEYAKLKTVLMSIDGVCENTSEAD
ncbi:MAG: hypothetical protein O3A63_09015 [Proteobacteria bacterium]|nr:hypothetical protein [Pseudomonadota bacterium]